MKTTLKVIGQIVLILLVAGIISGGIYAVVHYNILNLPMRGDGPGGRGFQGQPGGLQSAAPNFRGGDGGFEGRDRGPNLLRGMFGIGTSLIKLAVIVVGVLFVQNLIKNRRVPKMA